MSSMNPFDPAGHLASLWGRSGDALLDAQRSLVQELAGWMPSVAPEPAPPDEGYEAARCAFARSWETALDVSRAVRVNLSGPGDPALADTLGHLLDPAAWFARASGRDPGPGPGEIPATTSLLDAATLVQRRALEHDVVMVEAWMQAAGAFARALHAATGQGIAPASPESVTALWSEHADPIFTETERSDAFRRSRDRLAAARADLETAQNAVGQIHGYANRRDLDDLRETVARLRRHIDEVMTRREPRSLLDVSPRPPLLYGHEAESTDEPVEVPPEADPRSDVVVGSLLRHTLRPHGANGPALLLVGPPADPAARDVTASLVRQDIAIHEVVWSEAAWAGSLDDLVRDLASALTSGHVVPVALVGVGPGAIPLACLAARRKVPAFVAIEAPFAFDDDGPHKADPGWLAAIRRDDALMRSMLTIDGEPIDLATITCPVLNLVPGTADGLAAAALAHLVASDDYAEHRVSDPEEAGPIVAEWLAQRHLIGSRVGTMS